MVEITRSANPRYFQSYFNPGDREVHPEAFAVHGLSNEFLKGAPTFEENLPEIFDFLDGVTQLVIHNAAYDVGFLRDECTLIDHICPEYQIIDTLHKPATKFPGHRHILATLCNRFVVDTSPYTKHHA